MKYMLFTFGYILTFGVIGSLIAEFCIEAEINRLLFLVFWGIGMYIVALICPFMRTEGRNSL